MNIREACWFTINILVLFSCVRGTPLADDIAVREAVSKSAGTKNEENSVNILEHVENTLRVKNDEPISEHAVNSLNTSETNDIYFFLNQLYNQHQVFTVDENIERWEREIEEIEKELLLFFNSPESLVDDILTRLPFLESTTSGDGLLTTYTWNRKMDGGSSGSLEYSTIVRYIDSNNNPVVILKTYFKCDTIYQLNEDVCLFYGFYYGGHRIIVHQLWALTLVKDRLIPYPVFDGDALLLFAQDGSGELDLWTLLKYERLIDYDFNFEHEPFYIRFTYTDIIDNVDDSEFREIDIKDIACSSLEFVFDGTKFVGDYEHLSKLTP
jgi:hypothetical protein